MAKIDERVASLEASQKIIRGIVAVLLPVLILWGGYITSNVIAMKQALADGGNVKLVTELKSPSSTEQLRANLNTIIAQVETARVNGTKPNVKKVEAISNALDQVVQKNSQMTEAWQAAATLVSYRSEPTQAALEDCLAKGPDIAIMGMRLVGKLGTPNIEFPTVLPYSNCTFVLSDVDGFNDTPEGKLWKQMLASGSPGDLRFSLTNVRVVYRQGIIIPFKELTCTGCTFDFDIASPPPGGVRKLTEQLLLARDYSNIKVTSSGAM